MALQLLLAVSFPPAASPPPMTRVGLSTLSANSSLWARQMCSSPSSMPCHPQLPLPRVRSCVSVQQHYGQHAAMSLAMHCGRTPTPCALTATKALAMRCNRVHATLTKPPSTPSINRPMQQHPSPVLHSLCVQLHAYVCATEAMLAQANPTHAQTAVASIPCPALHSISGQLLPYACAT